MGLGIDADLAGRAVDAETALDRLNNLHAFGRAGVLHRLRPQQQALIMRNRNLVDQRGVTELVAPGLEESGVHRRVELRRIVVGDEDAVAFLGRQNLVLVADAERRRGHRDLRLHAGGRPLAEERHVGTADKRAHHHVGRRCLDLRDRRAEIGNVEREEVGLDHLAASVLAIFLHPAGGDLAVIVVGGENVDLLAPLLDRGRHQHLDLLRRRHAVDADVAVANAALVEHVVEIEDVGLVQRLPDRLARG